MNRLEIIKFLLLDMISGMRTADRDVIASLTSNEWDAFEEMAAQHRIEPLLYQRYADVGSSWAVPADVRSRWAEAYRQSALRSLQLQRTLIGVDAALKAAGIPYAALKGAWLAWHAYPHPALRPMRDIDILVPRERTLEAFDVLLAGNFVRLAQYMSSPSEALEQHKHLPPIVDSRTSISVEVHSRLIEHGRAKGGASDINLLHNRVSAKSGNTDISYLSKIDSLLHLIEHSAYDHLFNNGPAVLIDIAMLVKSGVLDWKSFWKTAQSQDRVRGCTLVLAMVERYHGDVGIAWPADVCKQIPEPIVKSAALMMLQDFNCRASVNLSAEFKAASGWKRVDLVKRRLVTSRHMLASFSGLSLNDKLIWLVYPIWLIARFLQYARAQLNRSVRAETQRAGQVVKWLEEGHFSRET
jgi:hypothetical protein